MAGAILAARMMRVPVLLDGFICGAAIAPAFATALCISNKDSQTLPQIFTSAPAAFRT